MAKLRQLCNFPYPWCGSCSFFSVVQGWQTIEEVLIEKPCMVSSLFKNSSGLVFSRDTDARVGNLVYQESSYVDYFLDKHFWSILTTKTLKSSAFYCFICSTLLQKGKLPRFLYICVVKSSRNKFPLVVYPVLIKPTGIYELRMLHKKEWRKDMNEKCRQ